MNVTASPTPYRDPEDARDVWERLGRLIEDLQAIEGVRAHISITVDVRLDPEGDA